MKKRLSPYQKRARKNKKIILAGLWAFTFAAILFAFLQWFMQPSPEEWLESEEPEAVLMDYLKSAEQEDIQSAYSLVHEVTKGYLSQEALAAAIRSHRASYEGISRLNLTSAEKPRYYQLEARLRGHVICYIFGGRVTYNTGATAQIVASMDIDTRVNDHSGWTVKYVGILPSPQRLRQFNEQPTDLSKITCSYDDYKQSGGG